MEYSGGEIGWASSVQVPAPLAVRLIQKFPEAIIADYNGRFLPSKGSCFIAGPLDYDITKAMDHLDALRATVGAAQVLTGADALPWETD